jgi:hypothetical protein
MALVTGPVTVRLKADTTYDTYLKAVTVRLKADSTYDTVLEGRHGPPEGGLYVLKGRLKPAPTYDHIVWAG